MIFAVGSYTNHSSPAIDARGRGISVYKWDDLNDTCRLISVYQDIRNPSYLDWDSVSRRLYAVSEVNEGTGAVIAFDLDENGSLTFLGQQKGPGRAGCHLTVLPAENRLFAASYSDGRLTCYTLKDGDVGPVILNHSYKDGGPETSRQKSPHAHQVLPGPDANRIYVCDLGSDVVWMHHLDALAEPPLAALRVPSGYGPRHLAFDPSGDFAYVLCELIPRLLVTTVNPANGKMKIIQELDTVEPRKTDLTTPAAPATSAAPAAVKVHPSGRTVAVSNRFDDTIAVFDTGYPERVNLSLADRFFCRGKTPRDITFSPDGSRLFIANQDSHTITNRSFDVSTGMPLNVWGSEINTGSPVCIVML